MRKAKNMALVYNMPKFYYFVENKIYPAKCEFFQNPLFSQSFKGFFIGKNFECKIFCKPVTLLEKKPQISLKMAKIERTHFIVI